MGLFIEITIDVELISSDEAQEIVDSCPVDIFVLNEETLFINPDQVDECTFCSLCLEIAPSGAIIIQKKYKDEQISL